ncbi:MAG TPA: SRPBCC family protein [Bacteroidia bacterium]|nr:SRPBCC family protein [Bacteroidia bacterium]
MKIVKIVFLALLSFILLALLVAIFVPRTFTVSSSETILKPKLEVFNYVRFLDKQREYSIWVLADPLLVPEIRGTDGEVGAIQSWNSKIEDVGEGEQEITSLSPDRIEVDIRFKRPFKGNARAAFLLKALNENETELVSEFYGEANYPFNLMAYTFGRKMLRQAEEKNLQNIKRILEKTEHE